jgi:hypothetical protein
MKVNELKQIIKPLIKECLKEVLVEEGFTKMLSEATKPEPVIQQIKKAEKDNLQEVAAQKAALREMQENKKRMLDAIGRNGFDAFAGTQPLQEDVQVKSADPGIDISGLMGNKQVWKQTLDAMNGKKDKR